VSETISPKFGTGPNEVIPSPRAAADVTTEPPPQRRPLLVGGALTIALVATLASTQGAQKATLAVVGLGLGIALFHSRFGFTSAWRQLVAVGQGRALQAHMVMLAIAVVAFSIVIAGGSAFFGATPSGFVAPITLGLLVGSVLFGIGMQLGGSCASGTLFATGAGHLAVLLTLGGFIVGSMLGVAGWSFWTSGPGFVQIAEGIIRRRRPPAIEAPPTAHGALRVLRGAWPIWVGAIALALLNVGVLVVTGRPWAVTAAFRLWASKLLDAVGFNVASWSYWDGRPGLDQSILADTTTVSNFGIIVGALVASAAAGGFALTRRVPGRAIAASLLGGTLMGYGATFAAGCNIGAYFSGIASASLHGFVWGAMALIGTWLGLLLRPVFGLSVPKPSDSVC
jgi:uncharacterized membrane protein YedE/YeeE